MPVRKLFWDDPYATDCEAVITSADGDVVTVDRTVAFAFSGGQESDAGTIAGREILWAKAEGLEIVYSLGPGQPLRVGERVTVTIDGARRLRLIRLHFAAELALELATRMLPDARKVGAHISAEKARIDFAWDGYLAAALPQVAAEIERLVSADLPIISAFSDVAAQRRYWEIAGFARVACGGTHPRRTGEVGRVALKRANPGAGKERIEITLAD